jgi:two-component system, LytTR family, response regulator
MERNITALIVDDEAAGRHALQGLLQQVCPFVQLVGLADSVAAAQSCIATYRPELVLLDIAMPGQNGFELLAGYESLPFQVIFVTAHESHAIHALRMAATDYLLKPVHEDDLAQAIRRVLQKPVGQGPAPQQYQHLWNGQPPEKIALPDLEGIRYVRIKSIIRCEAASSYTLFYLADGQQHIACRTLAEFEDLLAPLGFLRVHHSHLINAAEVEKYHKGRGGYVVMSDGASIEVSVRRKEDFLKKMGQLGR